MRKQESKSREQTTFFKGLEEGELSFAEGYPNIEDIARHIHFEASSGTIWLHDQRAVVLPTAVLKAFRTTIVESMGLEEARKMMTTLGYEIGQSDALMAKKFRASGSFHSIIAAGPQLVHLKGIANVDPVNFKVDFEKGTVFAEAALIGSIEADLHIQDFGTSNTPACWICVGHASGFFSWYLGKPVLFREVECRARGNNRCMLVGKPLEEYENAEEDVKYFKIPGFMRYKPPTSGRKRSPRQWFSSDTNTLSDPDIGDKLIGASAGIKIAIQMLKKVAETDATVLFTGESGVGKEVFSRALHGMSKRAGEPFVALNCAAIPDTLLESELFGAERGAYTGADASRPGRFERANGGTLFLDEISSMSLTAQGKLLRVLQEGELERLGGNETLAVDVRIVAATNVDLKAEVAANRFREDLFYRLNVFPIYIPRLRSRRDDIPLLVDKFFVKYTELHGKRPAGFTVEAMEALLVYDWPGNIRELENVIERSIILATDGELIDTNHLFNRSEHMTGDVLTVQGEGDLSLASSLDLGWDELARRVLQSGQQQPVQDFERALVHAAIEKTNGNVSSAATILGITRGQLDYRLKKYDE